MPTGELLAASVFVTYLGEGGGVEGGIGLGDGVGMGASGGGEGGGARVVAVAENSRPEASAKHAPPVGEARGGLQPRQASDNWQTRSRWPALPASPFYMATHCSTREPRRLSPPQGGTRLREEPMNTTVLSVVVIELGAGGACEGVRSRLLDHEHRVKGVLTG